VRQSRAIAAELRIAIDEGVALIATASESATAYRPRPDGWCAREIVGHLIDSACNNHRRFIINQTAPTLLIEPYDQNEWTSRQRYADRPAAELACLWAAYNRHLANVIEAIPEDVALLVRGDMQHDFPFTESGSTAATLANLADDYVGHLRHHLQQIRVLLTHPSEPDSGGSRLP
jgi:hypothetical protein